MDNQNKNLLLIFTRNPEKGKVKTRLAKDVGEDAALEIYKFLLDHTVVITKDLETDKRVYYSEKIHHEDIWDEKIYSKFQQKGKDLGERMKNAFAEGFEAGYRHIIIIGSDMYDLSAVELDEAFTALRNKEFVMGPAKDGGYYLLGMRSLEESLFIDKEWGTSSVLQSSLDDMRERNFELLSMKNDVDHYDDIKGHENFQQFFQHMNK